MNIKNNLVTFQFSDNQNVIHEVDIDSILDGGIPINQENGQDMEFVAATSQELATIKEQIQNDLISILGLREDIQQELIDDCCQAVVDNFQKIKP